jgi:DNA-binding NarL/FixJ family response regulator
VGVDAYLLKGFAAIKLNMAIQHIWSDQFYIDPLMHQDLIRSLKPIKKQLSELSELSELSSHHIIAHNGEHIKITDRHILLVSAIYHNLKREEIADLMNISPNTVDMNIKRIKNKMGVENRLTLIQLFSDWGLLQPVAFKNKQN